jgi:hypothetical protein
MKTIQQIAAEVCNNMMYDEEKHVYHQKVPGDPQWIQDIIYACHYQGMLPDDYVFEWVYAFCKEISQLDEKNDPWDIEVCSETYSHDLLKWFSSNLARADFVNDVIDTYLCGEKCNIFCMLGLAQEREMQEVLWTIIDKLQDRIDEESENGVIE